MAVDVIMPKLGESITEGTIIEWKKDIGDKIGQDETILEISTDKVDSEVPSPAPGILLEVLFKENDVVPVGEIIARIGEEGEVIDSDNTINNVNDNKEENSLDINSEEFNEKKISSPMDRISNPETIDSQSSKKFYSPLVKSIAKVEGVSVEELNTINGSGSNGRVNKADLLQYISNRGNVETDDGILNQNIESSDIKQHLSNEVETMSRMRQKIASHMVESKKISPHVYSTVEADVTNLVKFTKENKVSFQDKYGTKLTYTPLFIDACIKAIQEYPLINVSLDNEKIIHHQNINMGVAVALPNNNLIVPVIKSCEEKNLLGLTRATADLADRARNNKLSPDEIFGSTFTITNPGVFGSLHGMAIINQPNVAILSIGSITKRPVVKETEFGDVIVVRNMMYLTLGYDHRIIDGAYGTRFLKRISNILESFNDQNINFN